MKIGIVNENNEKKNFPKVVKQSDPVNAGMYKAIFRRFVTFGFHPDDYNEGKNKFYTNFGFELIEDMAGVPVPKHVREFDDGTTHEGAKMVAREYPLMDKLHHKSNGFMIAKSLDPNVPIVTGGKDGEHQFIVEFDWKENIGKTVLIQVDLKTAKASGNKYNKILNVMPLGIPLEGELENTFFNLYDPDQQEVWEKGVYFWEKKKISERIHVAGEPEVVYGLAEKQDAPVVADGATDVPADFDDDIPF